MVQQGSACQCSLSAVGRLAVKGAHSREINELRRLADKQREYLATVGAADEWFTELAVAAADAAADLVSCHDGTGIDLHSPSASNWLALVEHLLGRPLDEEIL